MNICFSQKNEIENEFLKNFFSHKDTLIYTSESFGWNIMKEKFNKKKYKDYNLNNTNTIEFTIALFSPDVSGILSTGNYIFPITGGSGIYINAKGTVNYSINSNGIRAVTIIFS
jgi:hypothetical protein